ncbi:MAG: hypothetical protein VX998_05720 [Candidatus Thermoplasmatota archaeon]|nr:hypothetical protein [Candidatus Thermoplasmatota archaeon]
MEDGQTPFANWVKTNASTANLLSIIMLIFAAWAAVEIVTNVVGNEVPPVTGTEVPGDDQRTNDGKIIGLGAVAGTLGLVLQLLIPRDESDTVVHTEPETDEEIDEVVDIMMEDVESDDGEDDEEEQEVSDDEIVEEDSTDDGDSLEEEDQVVEDEAEETSEDEAPNEKEKTPVKKRKF